MHKPSAISGGLKPGVCIDLVYNLYNRCEECFVVLYTTLLLWKTSGKAVERLGKGVYTLCRNGASGYPRQSIYTIQYLFPVSMISFPSTRPHMKRLCFGFVRVYTTIVHSFPIPNNNHVLSNIRI